MLSLQFHTFALVLVVLGFTQVDAQNYAKCLLPKNRGICNANRNYYYFNGESRKCELSSFTTCPGNKNYFRYKWVCEKTCKRYLNVETVASNAETPGAATADICAQPILKGGCTNSYYVYGFNPSTKVCTRFRYSGCDGNDNRFKDYVTCKGVCVDKTLKAPAIPYHPQIKPHCFLPKVVGSCTRKFDQFYFDPKTLSCKPFVYTGCYGNANRFPTEARCKSSCWPDIPRFGVITIAG